MTRALLPSRRFVDARNVFALSKTLSSIKQVLSGEIGILATNVCTGVIMARLLGPEGRGEFTAIAMWPALAAGVLTLGITRSLTYHVARQSKGPSSVVLVGLSASFCFGLLAAALGSLAVPVWLREYPEHVVTFAQWAMLAAPPTLMMWSVCSILQGQGEFASYNRARYLPPLLILVGLGGLALFDVLNPFSAALVTLGSPLPILVAYLIRIVRSCRGGFSAPRRSLRQLLSYGVRAYGLDVGFRLSRDIDRVILVALVSPAALGIYVVARNAAMPVARLSLAVATVLLPEASRRQTEQGTRLLGRAAWLSTAMTSAAAGGLAIVAPPLIQLLYGDQFAAAIGPFRILLVNAVVASFATILAQAFMSSDRPGVAGLELALGLVVSTLCMLYLVPAFGASGAALAILISSVVRTAFILLCIPPVLKVSLRTLSVQRRDVEGLLARVRAMRG